jgi:hypothetical protein
MWNCHDALGRVPPAVVYGKDGKPLLSWRVMLLPLIEQDELFQEFHLDEAWDSPHNLALLPRMPLTYAAPPGKQHKVPPYNTVCHVFVGKGTAFESPDPLKCSATLLIVEAGKPVPWTKPEELVYDPNGPLPDMEGLFHDFIRVVYADASLHIIAKGTSEAALRALIEPTADKSKVPFE